MVAFFILSEQNNLKYKVGVNSSFSSTFEKQLFGYYGQHTFAMQDILFILQKIQRTTGLKFKVEQKKREPHMHFYAVNDDHFMIIDCFLTDVEDVDDLILLSKKSFTSIFNDYLSFNFDFIGHCDPVLILQKLDNAPPFVTIKNELPGLKQEGVTLVSSQRDDNEFKMILYRIEYLCAHAIEKMSDVAWTDKIMEQYL